MLILSHKDEILRHSVVPWNPGSDGSGFGSDTVRLFSGKDRKNLAVLANAEAAGIKTLALGETRRENFKPCRTELACLKLQNH